MIWESTVAEIFPNNLDNILEKYHGLELQQLLSMSAGVRDQFDNPAFTAINPDDTPSTQRISGLPLILSFDHELPIGEFHYANTSYLLASAMLEKTTNQNWRDLLTSKVMTRLEINEFGFGPPGTEGQLDQPLGHTVIDGEYQGLFVDNTAFFGPAGRVHMSLADIATYASFHLKGKSGEGTLLSPNVMQKLYQGGVPAGSGDLDNDSSYALGWEVHVDEDRVIHNGSNTLWYADLAIDFGRDFAFFVVTNAYEPTNSDVLDPEAAVFEVILLIDELIDKRIEKTVGDERP